MGLSGGHTRRHGTTFAKPIALFLQLHMLCGTISGAAIVARSRQMERLIDMLQLVEDTKTNLDLSETLLQSQTGDVTNISLPLEGAVICLCGR